MNNEKQTRSFDADVDIALENSRELMDATDSVGRVIAFPEQPPAPVDEETTVTSKSEASRKWRNRGKGALAATAAVGATLFLTHNSGAEPAPNGLLSFTERAQDSAQTPLQKDDKVLIDGIMLDPTKSDMNSGSEAVRNNEEVQEFMRDNPDEKAAIVSSAYTLPAVDEYAIVERDIDNDGDGDAIAVPVEKSRD